jgi:catechol 2,3-dioxygenase-like lactoylglutathione lyase family enzyme
MNDRSPFGTGSGTLFEAHVQTTDLERARVFYRETLGLEEAYVLDERSVAFYWVGGRGNAMLGVWGVTPKIWHPSHFAFTIDEARIDATLAGMRAAGVDALDFWGEPTTDPSVHTWMPACGIFFRDPDGNSLELLAMLAGDPRPDLGVIPLSEWYALSETPSARTP